MALTGISSSKLMTLTGWFQCANNEGGTILVGGSGATEFIKFSLSTATGKLTFTLKNAAGAAIWGVTTSSATVLYDDDAVHHFAISASLAAARGQFYIDGVSVAVTVNTALANDTIAFASADEWVVAAGLAAATPFVGSLYDVVLWPGLSLDLSVNDELQLVVANDSAQGLATSPSGVKPVGYGSEGRYLGEPAMLIFSSAFEFNRGVGGRFTRTGNVDEDAYGDGPSGYRLSPRWRTPGERWFASEQSGDPYPRSQTFIENREGLSSFGKRLGLDELDAQTHKERPGFNFSDMVLGIEEEDRDNDLLR